MGNLSKYRRKKQSVIKRAFHFRSRSSSTTTRGRWGLSSCFKERYSLTTKMDHCFAVKVASKIYFFIVDYLEPIQQLFGRFKQELFQLRDKCYALYALSMRMVYHSVNATQSYLALLNQLRCHDSTCLKYCI